MGDVEEITALVYRYAELLDGGDIDGVVELFADAAWRSGATGEVRRGHAQIRDVYDHVVLYDGIPRTRHLMTNVTVDVDDGADEATGRCEFTVIQGVDDGAPIATILGGRYLDRYRRGPDGWRFAEREFIADLLGDQSRHFR
ncbi:MAG TPA: nuclear transport factor 2 family protein [Acidimicrobiia bacterium]|nr:nuclear transport factor 2 family protein [Acidimicrobiia bacterium]